MGGIRNYLERSRKYIMGDANEGHRSSWGMHGKLSNMNEKVKVQQNLGSRKKRTKKMRLPKSP